MISSKFNEFQLLCLKKVQFESLLQISYNKRIESKRRAKDSNNAKKAAEDKAILFSKKSSELKISYQPVDIPAHTISSAWISSASARKLPGPARGPSPRGQCHFEISSGLCFR
jgi:hypothetical protein